MNKPPVRLLVLDCTSQNKEKWLKVPLMKGVLVEQAAKASLGHRRIELAFFRPEEERRMPARDSFDALLIPDSSYVPTMEFMEDNWLGRALRGFVLQAVSDAKMGLCIGFGMQAVAASFNIFAAGASYVTTRGFDGAYVKVQVTDEGRGDALFSSLPQKFAGLFANDDFAPRRPPEAIKLAKIAGTGLLAAFRIGGLYCIQWRPDMELASFLNSMRERGNHAAVLSALESHNQQSDIENRRILELFLRKMGE